MDRTVGVAAVVDLNVTVSRVGACRVDAEGHHDASLFGKIGRPFDRPAEFVSRSESDDPMP